MKSDLNPASRDIRRADLRRLPYDDGSLDVLVLDPPYAFKLSTHWLRDHYNRDTPNMTAEQCRELFREGMKEAARVLKPGGTLWVKCKDGVESALQRWQHVEVYEDARALGFRAQDLFVVLTAPPNPGRWTTQKHARKNVSYLWIFQKEAIARQRMSKTKPAPGERNRGRVANARY